MQPPNDTSARRHRDYHGPQTCLDTVDVSTATGTIAVDIPAQHRSCYWAILRYLYQNTDRPVSSDELCEGVRATMLDMDPLKWERFAGKTAGRDWRSRLVGNARNLCRLNGSGGYGRRLVEAGHVLRCQTRDGTLYFTLSTRLTPENLAPLKRGRKRSSTPSHPPHMG